MPTNSSRTFSINFGEGYILKFCGFNRKLKDAETIAIINNCGETDFWAVDTNEPRWKDELRRYYKELCCMHIPASDIVTYKKV
jgi:hypothetical protein